MGSIPGFDPGVRKIPWRKKWQPTPIFWPEKSQGVQSMGSQRVGHYWVTMHAHYTHTHTHMHTHTYRIFNCFFYLPFSISIWKHQHHESFWSFLTLLSTSSFVTQLLLQFQSSFTQKWEAWTNRMGLLTLKIVMPKNSFIFNDIFLFWSTMCSGMFVNLCDHISTTAQISVILPSNTQLIIIQKPMEQKSSFAVSLLMKKFFFFF